MPWTSFRSADVTQMMAGARNAPKQEQPKQAAEKVAEPKQAPEPEKNRPSLK